MRIPERRQKRVVSSRRGEIQPRGPAITRMAGRSVTAARKATPTAIANAMPTVENSPNLANIIPRKVIPTVAAEAAITLPMDVNALFTA